MKRLKEPIWDECYDCIWLNETGSRIYHCPFPICRFDEKRKFQRHIDIDLNLEEDEYLPKSIREAYRENKSLERDDEL